MNTEENVWIVTSFEKPTVDAMEVLAKSLECDVATLIKAIALHFGEQLGAALQIDERVLFPAMIAQLKAYIR